MKQLYLFLVLLFVCSSGLYAQNAAPKKESLVWYTDLMKAQDQSKATRKPIFGFFTGSDWCGWCHKLQEEVFSKPEFIKWAKKNVILLELDFPRQKQLAPELVQQNNNLQQAFHVSGFPTVWMFFMEKDSTENRMNIAPLGSLGYPSGAIPGKEQLKFLSEANKLLAKGKS